MKAYRTNSKEQVYFKEVEAVNNEYNCMKAVHVYADHTYQKWNGFGGAFTEAAGYTWSKLTPESQSEFVDAYFGENGNNYTFCRMHINSCDFSLGNYAYLDEEPDENWSKFDISRDKQYILPLVNAAIDKSSKEITFLSSPWSPPAFMKTNGEMNHGGSLKKEYALMWAQYIAKYIKEYAKEGIKVSYITVQNEPLAVQTWDSCIYTAEDESNFVRDYLGPVLHEEGLGDVKILIWDHNKELVYERARDVLADEKTSAYVDGVAFHWYTGDHFEALSLVGEDFPDKELIFTEGCVEYSRFADTNEVKKAQMYAHDIIGNMNHGAKGFIDWNLLLDEKGGPNHVGNFCASPIMADTEKGTLDKRLTYYYIGHFSRYIQPGAVRVAFSRYTSNLEVTSFQNPDGSRVAVIMNPTTEAVEFSIKDGDKFATYNINGEEIMTIVIE